MDNVEKVIVVLFGGDEKTWHKLLCKGKSKKVSRVTYCISHFKANAKKIHTSVNRIGKH